MEESFKGFGEVMRRANLKKNVLNSTNNKVRSTVLTLTGSFQVDRLAGLEIFNKKEDVLNENVLLALENIGDGVVDLLEVEIMEAELLSSYSDLGKSPVVDYVLRKIGADDERTRAYENALKSGMGGFEDLIKGRDR